MRSPVRRYLAVPVSDVTCECRAYPKGTLHA